MIEKRDHWREAARVVVLNILCSFLQLASG